MTSLAFLPTNFANVNEAVGKKYNSSFLSLLLGEKGPAIVDFQSSRSHCGDQPDEPLGRGDRRHRLHEEHEVQEREEQGTASGTSDDIVVSQRCSHFSTM